MVHTQKTVKSCNTSRLVKVIYDEHFCNRRPWPRGPRHCVTRSVPLPKLPKQQNIWTWTIGIPWKRITRPAEWISVSKMTTSCSSAIRYGMNIFARARDRISSKREKCFHNLLGQSTRDIYWFNVSNWLVRCLTKIKPSMNMMLWTCQSSGKNRKKPTWFRLLPSIMGLSSLALYFYEYCHGNACSVRFEASTSILLSIQVSSDVTLSPSSSSSSSLNFSLLSFSWEIFTYSRLWLLLLLLCN